VFESRRELLINQSITGIRVVRVGETIFVAMELSCNLAPDNEGGENCQPEIVLDSRELRFRKLNLSQIPPGECKFIIHNQ